MKILFSFVLIFAFNTSNSQIEKSFIEIDTLFAFGKSSSNVLSIVKEFPNLCCKEEYLSSDVRGVLYDSKPLLNLFGIKSFKSNMLGIIKLITASFCNNCNEPGLRVVLYEFSLNNQLNAKMLLSRIKKAEKEKGYFPFGKNWYYKKIKNKVYFIDALAEDKLNLTKVELQKRINKIIL